MSPASVTVQKYESMGKFMHEDPDSVYPHCSGWECNCLINVTERSLIVSTPALVPVLKSDAARSVVIWLFYGNGSQRATHSHIHSRSK